MTLIDAAVVYIIFIKQLMHDGKYATSHRPL